MIIKLIQLLLYSYTLSSTQAYYIKMNHKSASNTILNVNIPLTYSVTGLVLLPKLCKSNGRTNCW